MAAKKSSFDRLRDFLKLTRLVRVRDIANDREVKEIQQRLRAVFSQRMEPSVSFVASGKPFKIDPVLEAIAKPYDGLLKDLLEKMGPLPKVELPAGAEHWKDYLLREPRAQKHYDSVDHMLRQLLDGPWKWHVHPGHGSTELKNYVAYKTETGREVAFRLYGRSSFDRRVSLEIEIGADLTPEFAASFECDGKEFGSAAPEIKTAGPEALLDLCNIVIAGKLDRYNHESSKDQAIRKEAS